MLLTKNVSNANTWTVKLSCRLFYEGENMLVIHPDECIDCGVCEPECPVEAILSDVEDGIEKCRNK